MLLTHLQGLATHAQVVSTPRGPFAQPKKSHARVDGQCGSPVQRATIEHKCPSCWSSGQRVRSVRKLASSCQVIPRCFGVFASSSPDACLSSLAWGRSIFTSPLDTHRLVGSIWGCCIFEGTLGTRPFGLRHVHCSVCETSFGIVYPPRLSFSFSEYRSSHWIWECPTQQAHTSNLLRRPAVQDHTHWWRQSRRGENKSTNHGRDQVIAGNWGPVRWNQLAP